MIPILTALCSRPDQEGVCLYVVCVRVHSRCLTIMFGSLKQLKLKLKIEFH